MIILYLYLSNIEYRNDLSEERRLIAVDNLWFGLTSSLTYFVLWFGFFLLLGFAVIGAFQGGNFRYGVASFVIFGGFCCWVVQSYWSQSSELLTRYYAFKDRVYQDDMQTMHLTESNFMIIAFYLSMLAPIFFRVFTFLSFLVLLLIGCGLHIMYTERQQQELVRR